MRFFSATLFWSIFPFIPPKVLIWKNPNVQKVFCVLPRLKGFFPQLSIYVVIQHYTSRFLN